MAHGINCLLGIVMMTFLLYSVHAQEPSQGGDPKDQPKSEGDSSDGQSKSKGDSPDDQPKSEGDTSPPPNNGKTEISKGIIGYIEKPAWPVETVVLQFIDSLLIHTMKMQLPCSIMSFSPFKYNCTPLDKKQLGEAEAS